MKRLLSFVLATVLLTPTARAQEDIQKGAEYMMLNTTYLFLNRHALPKVFRTI